MKTTSNNVEVEDDSTNLNTNIHVGTKEEVVQQVEGAGDFPEKQDCTKNEIEPREELIPQLDGEHDFHEEEEIMEQENSVAIPSSNFDGLFLRNEFIEEQGFQNICFINSIVNGLFSLRHFQRIFPILDESFGTEFEGLFNGYNDQVEWIRDRLKNVSISEFLYGIKSDAFEALIALFKSMGLTPEGSLLDHVVKLQETTTCLTCSHTKVRNSSNDFEANGFLALPTFDPKSQTSQVIDIRTILSSFTKPHKVKEFCETCKKVMLVNKENEIIDSGNVLIMRVSDLKSDFTQRGSDIHPNRNIEVNGKTYTLKSVVEYNGTDHYTASILNGESWTLRSDMRMEKESTQPLHPYIIFYEVEDQEINTDLPSESADMRVEVDEHEHDCDLCEGSFYSHNGLIKHKVEAHGEPLDSWTDGPVLHENESHLDCQENEQETPNNPEQSNEDAANPQEDILKTNDSTIDCPKCGMNVSSKKLKRHQKSKKCSSTDKTYPNEKVQCEFCGVSVLSRNLIKHQKTKSCLSKRPHQNDQTSETQRVPKPRISKRKAKESIEEAGIAEQNEVKEKEAERFAQFKNNQGTKLGISKPQHEVHDKDIPKEIFDFKVPSLLEQKPCKYCGALKYPKNIEPENFCCGNGRVQIDVPEVPETLKELLENDKNFKEHIRKYNNSLALATWGCDSLDFKTWPNFKFQGKCYHAIGALKPEKGQPRKFAQWYIHDESISAEMEANGRIMDQYGSVDLSKETMLKLQNMLHEVNPYIKDFQTISEIPEELIKDIQFILKREGKPTDQHVRKYNLPTCEEVALITLNDKPDKADVQIKLRAGGVKHINDTNYYFDVLHYILLFPFGKPGWTYTMTDKLGDPLTCASYYKTLFQIRNPNECFNNILRSGKLFMEFVCTSFYKVERQRLKYLRDNQTSARAEKLNGLLDAIHRNDDNQLIGDKVYLSAKHHCSPRWYQRR